MSQGSEFTLEGPGEFFLQEVPGASLADPLPSTLSCTCDAYGPPLGGECPGQLPCLLSYPPLEAMAGLCVLPEPLATPGIAGSMTGAAWCLPGGECTQGPCLLWAPTLGRTSFLAGTQGALAPQVGAGVPQRGEPWPGCAS